MEIRGDIVQADMAEVWLRRLLENEPAPRVKPVKGPEAAVFRKDDREARQNKKREPLSGLDAASLKEVAEQTQAFLDDLNIQFDFELSKETGDIVIRILNRKTGELLREIPPEHLLKLHQKAAELRGVLFDKKV